MAFIMHCDYLFLIGSKCKYYFTFTNKDLKKITTYFKLALNLPFYMQKTLLKKQIIKKIQL